MFQKYKAYNSNIDLSDPNILLSIKAYELYSKYIYNGANYQINISYEILNAFESYFDDFDTLFTKNIPVNEMYQLFIKPTKEIEKLLKQTYDRLYRQ